MLTPFLSVLVPVYQNASTLPILFSEIAKLETCVAKLEIVFVNDGSSDDSLEVLVALFNQRPDLTRVINLTRNFGQIAALHAGLREVKGDCVAILSADMQDPPALIAKMVPLWEGGSRVVIAERSERDEGRVQIFLSSLVWKITRKLAVPNYPAGGFDFCLLDRAVIEILNNVYEKNSHIFALIFSFGFPYAILPYRRQKRLGGKSQWTAAKKFKVLIDIVLSFSYVPVRVISGIGILVAAFSVGYALFSIAYYFIYGTPYTGWTTIIVLICLIGGVTLTSLGILGEYIWRILDQTRKRPQYIVLNRFGNQSGHS